MDNLDNDMVKQQNIFVDTVGRIADEKNNGHYIRTTFPRSIHIMTSTNSDNSHNDSKITEVETSATDLLWGVAAISKEINRTERQTYYLLESGHIPKAKKIGSQWLASKPALRRFLQEGLE